MMAHVHSCRFGAVFLLLATLAMGCRRHDPKIDAASGSDDVTRAKGFKWVSEYYPMTNGTQRPKAVITGTEARYVTNGVVLVTNPRIESYREDGALEWVATSVEATVDMFSKSATGTNVASFVTAQTNLYLTGRGFLWLSTNATLILSNQTYTWVDRTNTNTRARQ